MNTKIVLITLLNFKWNHLSFESYLAVFIMIYFYIFCNTPYSLILYI